MMSNTRLMKLKFFRFSVIDTGLYLATPGPSHQGSLERLSSNPLRSLPNDCTALHCTALHCTALHSLWALNKVFGIGHSEARFDLII